MKASDFGLYLRSLREKASLSMGQLARDSKISQPYISQIERGDRGVPSPEILNKLSGPLGVPYEELMIKAGYWDQNFSDENKVVFEQISNERAKTLESLFELLKQIADDDGIFPDELHRELFDIFGGHLPQQVQGQYNFDEWYLLDFLKKEKDELTLNETKDAINEFNKFYNYTTVKNALIQYKGMKKYEEEFLEELLELSYRHGVKINSNKPIFTEIDLNDVLKDKSMIIKYNGRPLSWNVRFRLKGYLEALEIIDDSQ